MGRVVGDRYELLEVLRRKGATEVVRSTRPHVARTSVDYARMLLERGAGGDGERARALLAHAASTARDSAWPACLPTSTR